MDATLYELFWCLMQKYHLIETGDIVAAAPNRLLYGRLIATLLKDGKLVCDNHVYRLDADPSLNEGEALMIWRENDYFCCRLTEYEKTYGHRYGTEII